MFLSFEHARIRLDYLKRRIRYLPQGHVHLLESRDKKYKTVWIKSYKSHPELEHKYHRTTRSPGSDLLPLVNTSTKIRSEITDIESRLEELREAERRINKNAYRYEPRRMGLEFYKELKATEDSNPYPKPKVTYEHNGILMRSKGEKLLAEHLDELGYQYAYEPELKLKNKKIYPDFALYIPEIDKVILIEYMGAWSKEDYVYDAGEKFKELTRNNFIPSRDVIYVCESDNSSFDMTVANCQINAIILSHTEFVTAEAV